MILFNSKGNFVGATQVNKQCCFCAAWLPFYKIRETVLINRQITIPASVGRSAAIKVHLILPLSFFTVSNVVEQGQCRQENITVQRAVICVQPFEIKISFTACVEKASLKTLPPLYIIRIIGRTISLAGSPNIKAVSITPSKPISFPSGSKNVLIILRMFSPPI